MHYLIQFSRKSHERDVTILYLLQMGKGKPKETNLLKATQTVSGEITI